MAKQAWNWNSDGVTLPGKGIKKAIGNTMPKKMSAIKIAKPLGQAKMLSQAKSALSGMKFNSKATAKNSWGSKAY